MQLIMGFQESLRWHASLSLCAAFSDVVAAQSCLCLCVRHGSDAGMLIAEGGIWRHPGHVRHL